MCRSCLLLSSLPASAWDGYTEEVEVRHHLLRFHYPGNILTLSFLTSLLVPSLCQFCWRTLDSGPLGPSWVSGLLLIRNQGLRGKGSTPACHGAPPATGPVPEGPAVLALHLWVEKEGQWVGEIRGSFQSLIPGQAFGIGYHLGEEDIHVWPISCQKIHDIVVLPRDHFREGSRRKEFSVWRWWLWNGFEYRTNIKLNVTLIRNKVAPRVSEWADRPGEDTTNEASLRHLRTPVSDTDVSLFKPTLWGLCRHPGSWNIQASTYFGILLFCPSVPVRESSPHWSLLWLLQVLGKRRPLWLRGVWWPAICLMSLGFWLFFLGNWLLDFLITRNGQDKIMKTETAVLHTLPSLSRYGRDLLSTKLHPQRVGFLMNWCHIVFRFVIFSHPYLLPG